MDNASLFMSWTSASVGPSGRQIVNRLSTTGSRPWICSCQVGSSLIWSAFHGDVEVAEVEVVVRADLLGREAELLGRVVMRALGAGAVRNLPLGDRCFDRGG